jgi:CRP-like cAMP-binding protein
VHNPLLKTKTIGGQEFKSIFAEKENRNYKVINELGEGSYFGEISLITLLKRTSSVLSSIGKTTCGYLTLESFNLMIDIYPDIHEKFIAKTITYHDDFFKTREWMIRSLGDFRKLRKDYIRKFILQ